jgi:hypothetical protein
MRQVEVFAPCADQLHHAAPSGDIKEAVISMRHKTETLTLLAWIEGAPSATAAAAPWTTFRRLMVLRMPRYSIESTPLQNKISEKLG